MYLPTLTIRLATGLGNVPEEQRNRHAGFFRRRQRADGGFAGREGDSDLYYTGFALRALAMLGELSDEPAERAAEFLRGKLAGQTPVVDFLALIQAANLLEMAAGIDVFADSRPDWRESVAAMLETFRRADGGYAKGPEGNAGSTYHSFLVVLCQQLIGVPLVEPNRLAAFVQSQRRDDGGFVEIRAMRRSGTNPTAAAVAQLKILDRLDHETAEGAVDFLLDMQTDEGGLRANTRIPIADLLSTFTGLLTLSDLGYARELDLDALRRYVRALEQPDGGFHGAAWDEATDVEYAFYGLGTLALLQ